MTGFVCAVDLDGSLVGNWPAQATCAEHLLAVAPHQAVIERVNHLTREGVRFVVITGRQHVWREVTLRQLQLHLGWTPPLVMAPGWPPEAMAQGKAAALRAVGARAYIGDSRWDERAAQLAGNDTLFIEARRFAEGAPLPFQTGDVERP